MKLLFVLLLLLAAAFSANAANAEVAASGFVPALTGTIPSSLLFIRVSLRYADALVLAAAAFLKTGPRTFISVPYRQLCFLKPWETQSF